MIYNAAYVCTDSFHGTVFSILFNKNFYVFRRFNKSTKESTNNRVGDFLGELGLEERMLSGAEILDDVVCAIDYADVMQSLAK